MKKILLKRMRIENFKGTRSFELSFDTMLTEIHGANGSGKTTLFDAYMWLLTGKDSKGSENFKIQPVDGSNETIPKLVTTVDCLFSIDGIECSFRRSLRQKWVKPKGKDTEILKGNETDYFVDGVPMTATAFGQKVKETFCDVDKLRMMSSVFHFFTLPVKDARALLVQMAGDMPVILTQESFPLLFEDVKQSKSVEGSKQKALFARKRDEEARVGIPLRIDENERRMPSHDFASLKIEADNIERRICEIDGILQRNADAAIFDACADLKVQLNEVRSQIDDCRSSFVREREKAVSKYTSQLEDARRRLEENSLDISSAERRKSTLEAEINDCNKSLERLKREWSEVNSMEFNDTTESACPTCGRPFDEDMVNDKRNELIRRFNTEKVERLKDIGQSGSVVSERKLKTEKDMSEVVGRIDSLRTVRKKLEDDIRWIKEKVDSIPTVQVMQESSSEYMSLLSREASIKEKISIEQEKASRSHDDSDMENEKLALKARQKDVLRMLGEESIINDVKKRREQLEQEAVDVSSRIASHDALLHEIHEYGKAKILAVEEKVSDMFSIIKFQMYERNVTNDGEKEICEPLIDGVPYTGNVNYASKVNAGIDVVNAISRWTGVSLPLFIDNKESVSELVYADMQVITLTVDSSCETLVVK